MKNEKSEKQSANKLIIFIPIIIVLILLIAAGIIFFPKFTGSGDAELSYEQMIENMQLYDDAEMRISLYVPGDYEKTSNKFNNYYHKNEESMIYLTHNECNNDLENLSLSVQAEYAGQTDNFNLKKNSKVTKNGLDMCVMEYDYELNMSEESCKKSGMTVLFIANKECYVITCVADRDKYDLYRDDYVKTYETAFPYLEEE